MTMSRLTHHISHQFDKELEDIRSKVLAMGGLVEEHIHKVLECFAKGDFDEAEYVAVNDFKVNALEVEIDDDCTEILLRRQPAATDLRLVLSVSKTITDLERIGDEAEKIARLVLNLRGSGGISSYYMGMLSMGHHVRRMVRAALDAFARMDSESAFRIAQEDREIDAETDAIMRYLITYMMEDPRSITRVLDAVLSVRAFERIGDHARNICENVIYLVEGKDVRHVALEQVEQELRRDAE
ncbi:MAG: phosphate signaling complex protein PhoU [Proteobacteria bacterium]|jgi:phosphate transport system protein|nr:phosphate signaling complex protein PhoU [Pseudomonadota bacterium]MBK8958008.1 phosphate signaling complex protein PhoU [Pseudomonadota bacterium]MCC6710433.1 phosphate signaling complex protein PhoU [Gammaproteobacteria bacterium]